MKSYIGGAALEARVLYDEVSPEINWSDPLNRLIITSGPLGGTSFPGVGTVNFVTKGALTNGAASGQANGVFGAYLKLSGYDGIILQGRCDELVYLSINERGVKIRGAEKLRGLSTYETYSKLSGNVVEGKISTLGPAGENLVRFAGIFEREGHSSSKMALMPSWDLKELKR
ncbi:MAG: aldehyde ferredoxin oxidoreductase N-terminal domain-containing protein [Candidatus Bathyarchaeia archaeon]